MGTTIKLVTWNINGIRARLNRVLEFIDANQPDILCVQELKSAHKTFPFMALEETGYKATIHGQPAWNGVGLFTKSPVTDVRVGLDEQARVIAGTTCGVRVVNVYVPNGQKIGSEKHAYKLDWLDKLSAFLDQERATYTDFVLTGDFNVAPEDIDVAHPEEWVGKILCDPAARAKLQDLNERFGLTDLHRLHAPGPGVYTWWDYRTSGFNWNDGVRIDHILATPGVRTRCVNTWVDLAERGREKPSDHTPVLTRLLPA